MKKGVRIGFVVLGMLCYIASAVLLYKGYDKMTHYFQSDTYYTLNHNAYVGGDAYNYIINGNYATGFFVLSMGFLLTGTIFLCSSVVICAVSNKCITSAQTSDSNGTSNDELPDL